jgi:hypothetical protein
MDRETMKKLMGMNDTGGTAYYKLNKVQMSGDSGEFRLSDLVSERERGQKPNVKELGKELNGVILKMRWMLSKYDEPNNVYYSSTEYDDKWKDQITVYPSKERGSVEDLKTKFNLSTQRIVYFYIPSEKQVARLVVKASALSGKKNPGGEFGLFEYIDEFAKTETLPCEFITTCTGVFREGTNQDGTKNKRKDHYAMTFKSGRKLSDTEFEKVQKMILEVAEKTSTTQAQETTTSDGAYLDESQKIDRAFDVAFDTEAANTAKDTINDDDLPF